MKRIIAILCALMALTSCKRIDFESLFERKEQIKVDLTIDKEDTFGGSPETRATFKDAWDDGDVVFVFIRDVPAPKYLEMKYSKGEWTATPKNGLTADDLRNAPSKQMTGVFSLSLFSSSLMHLRVSVPSIPGIRWSRRMTS